MAEHVIAAKKVLLNNGGIDRYWVCFVGKRGVMHVKSV
jgi:hypothetical protein